MNTNRKVLLLLATAASMYALTIGAAILIAAH